MPGSLLKIQTILNEKAETNSVLFYKKNYKISTNMYMSTGAQKEYSKALELLLNIFYFYVANIQFTKFKTNILSTGIAKKEQIYKSTLNLRKIDFKEVSLFSPRLQNFLFLLNIIDTNFYKTIAKYFIKKSRSLKNFQVLFLNKIQNVLLSGNKINRSQVNRMQYIITFRGGPVSYFNLCK